MNGQGGDGAGDERGQVKFVTDLGRNYVAVSDAGERITIPRYAVWHMRRRHYDGVPTGLLKPEVTDSYESWAECEFVHGTLPVYHFDNLENEKEEQ